MTDTTTLTGFYVNETYHQLLFVEAGATTTRKPVRSGLGVESVLMLGIDNAAFDNILFDGNTISILDTDGDLVLRANGTGLVDIEDVAIVGGSISSLDTPLAVADGGTGSDNATDARTALGLGTIATQAASAVAITGGTVSNLTSLSGAAISASSSMGYATGAGGAQTQGTSKSTAVTLDAICGQITMHNASLNGSTSVSFTLNNSEISAITDVVVVNIGSGATANSYVVGVDNVAVGSCRIHLRNVSGGALGEALVLNFAVLRAVSA